MVEVVAAIIRDNDKFMICQRPSDKSRALLWEFPGGKVENGETMEDALIRECMEELNIVIKPEKIFDEATHEYPDITVHITFFDAYITGGKLSKKEHNDIRWISALEIKDYEFCPADNKMLSRMMK